MNNKEEINKQANSTFNPLQWINRYMVVVHEIRRSPDEDTVKVF